MIDHDPLRLPSSCSSRGEGSVRKCFYVEIPTDGVQLAGRGIGIVEWQLEPPLLKEHRDWDTT